MGSQKLISLVVQRLTRLRQINFLLSLASPAAALALCAAALWWNVLPASLVLPAVCAASLLTLGVLQRTGRYLSVVRPEEAASQIDSVTGAQERFLTLATLPAKARGIDPATLKESVAVLETQGAEFGKQFDVRTHVPFVLEKPVKQSLAASPVFVAVLLLLMVFRARPAELRPPTIVVSASRAAALRELQTSEAALPADVREQIDAVADALEEKGLLDPETKAAVATALQTIDEHQVENLSNIQAGKQEPVTQQAQPAPPQQQQNTASEAAEPPELQPTKQNEPSQPQQQQQQQDQTPASQQGNQQPQSGEAKKPEQEQANAEQSSEEKTGGGGESQQKSGGQGSSQGGQGAEQQKQGGEQGGSQQSSAGEQGQKAEQAKQQGAQGAQQDEKKDQTGVGEGKGQGKSGDKKEQKGEAQSGTSDSGAKEGAAKNESGGGSGAGKSQNKQQQGGQQGSQQGQQQQGQGQKSGEQQGQNGSQDLQNVKNELSKLQNEIEKQDQKAQGSNSGKQEQSAQQQGQQDSKKQEQGAAPENKKASEGVQGEAKQSEGKGEGKGAGNSQQQPGEKQGQKGQGQQPQSGEPQKQAGAQNKDQNSRPGEQPPKPGSEQGSANTRPQNSRSGEQQRENQGKIETNRDTTEKHAAERPSPDDTAPRFGPPAGGKEGGMAGKKREEERVDVPQEEKVIVNALGAEDPARLKSKGGAHARTELGGDEFQKPEADVGGAHQPIPLEYRDLLGGPRGK